MRKILIILFLVLSFLSPNYTYSADCEFNGDVGGSLENCLSSSHLVNPTAGFPDKIKDWTNNLATVFGLLAVGSIVYGSILLAVSVGEEEKIKKAKDVIKWGLIGFLGIVSASTLITLVVTLMYSLENNM